MPVLMWVAVLVVGWCLVSVATALVLGTWLRRRTVATDPAGALRPLDTGPLRLWLGELPGVPATPDELGRRAGWDELVQGLPVPRQHDEADHATSSR